MVAIIFSPAVASEVKDIETRNPNVKSIFGYDHLENMHTENIHEAKLNPKDYYYLALSYISYLIRPF